MVQKLKPKHEITKGLPKEFQQLADSAIDHFGKFLDNLNARDLVYLTSYISATILIYNTVNFLEQPLSPFGIFYDPRSREDVLKDHPSAIMLPLGYWFMKKTEVKDKFDYTKLFLSLVGAYGLLKLDLGDVTSAIGKINSYIGTISAVA